MAHKRNAPVRPSNILPRGHYAGKNKVSVSFARPFSKIPGFNYTAVAQSFRNAIERGDAIKVLVLYSLHLLVVTWPKCLAPTADHIWSSSSVSRLDGVWGWLFSPWAFGAGWFPERAAIVKTYNKCRNISKQSLMNLSIFVSVTASLLIYVIIYNIYFCDADANTEVDSDIKMELAELAVRRIWRDQAGNKGEYCVRNGTRRFVISFAPALFRYFIYQIFGPGIYGIITLQPNI